MHRGNENDNDRSDSRDVFDTDSFAQGFTEHQPIAALSLAANRNRSTAPTPGILIYDISDELIAALTRYLVHYGTRFALFRRQSRALNMTPGSVVYDSIFVVIVCVFFFWKGYIRTSDGFFLARLAAEASSRLSLHECL